MTQQTKSIRTQILTAIMASVIGLGFVTAAIAARLGVDANTRLDAGAGIGTLAQAQTGATAETHASAGTQPRWGSGVLRNTVRVAQRKHKTSDIWPAAKQQ